METELKILEVDPERIVERLEGLGATRVFDGRMEARYFDRNRELHDAGIVLRLRLEGSQGVLAVKRKVPDADYKVMDEHETTVDFDEAATMLGMLGYVETIRERKHRTSYRLDDVEVEIESYEGLGIPPYVEVEGEPDAIERAIRELGLEDHERFPGGVGRLRERYQRRT